MSTILNSEVLISNFRKNFCSTDLSEKDAKTFDETTCEKRIFNIFKTNVTENELEKKFTTLLDLRNKTNLTRIEKGHCDYNLLMISEKLYLAANKREAENRELRFNYINDSGISFSGTNSNSENNINVNLIKSELTKYGKVGIDKEGNVIGHNEIKHEHIEIHCSVKDNVGKFEIFYPNNATWSTSATRGLGAYGGTRKILSTLKPGQNPIFYQDNFKFRPIFSIDLPDQNKKPEPSSSSHSQRAPTSGPSNPSEPPKMPSSTRDRNATSSPKPSAGARASQPTPDASRSSRSESSSGPNEAPRASSPEEKAREACYNACGISIEGIDEGRFKAELIKEDRVGIDANGNIITSDEINEKKHVIIQHSENQFYVIIPFRADENWDMKNKVDNTLDMPRGRTHIFKLRNFNEISCRPDDDKKREIVFTIHAKNLPVLGIRKPMKTAWTTAGDFYRDIVPGAGSVDPKDPNYFYSFLGLDRDATEINLIDNYEKLNKMFNIPGNPYSAEALRRLNTAYNKIKIERETSRASEKPKSKPNEAPKAPPPTQGRTQTASYQPQGIREPLKKEWTSVQDFYQDRVPTAYTDKRDPNYNYSFLGLSKHATIEELRKNYRRLAFAFHPDKNKSPYAEDAFKDLEQAYNLIKIERKFN